MFSKLFKRKEPAKIATTPPGEQLFAIGDVHGRLDLLNELLAIILADCHDQARRGIRSHIVMLGDYVDRGQSSAQVVERLMALQEEWPETILLRGNHEQIMLEVLGERPDLETFESWLHYGGRETLISYGLTLQDVFNENSQLILNKARRAIPQAHVEWMSRLKNNWQRGDYYFTHAGVRPGIALAEQRPHDLLWIREPFLSSREDFGMVVVHGHSVSNSVDDRPNRIGIDTGAYASGVLTAVRLTEDGSRSFVDTRVLTRA